MAKLELWVKLVEFCLRVREKIDSQKLRLDLGRIWLRRLSKTTGIPTRRDFEDFAIEVRPKMI